MGELIVKDNSLINASYNLELTEQRLILLAIIHARKTGKGITSDSKLEIYANDYIQQFQVEKHAAYEALKNAVNNLFNRQFSFQEKSEKGIGIVKSRWVSRIKYIDSAAILEITFAPDVVPLIMSLEEHFTSYQLQQITQLTSKYAIRLYELIIAWRDTGRVPFFKLQDFRSQLGLSTNEYSLMSDFKKRVLDPSIAQINQHTDITVSYEQHKAGRTITGFSFTFTQKKQPKDVTQKSKKAPSKSKPVKQEQQLDWMTADILDRFNSLSPDHQKLVVDQVETSLKGAKQARFKAARLSSIERLVADFALDINEAMIKNIK